MVEKPRLALWDDYESAQSYDWIEGIEYKLHLPIGIRQIYEFWLYTKIANNATEDVILRLKEDRATFGLSKAVQSAIRHCKMKRLNAINSQREYYEQQIRNAEAERILHEFEVKSGRFEEQLKEAERCRNLDDEQRSLREKEYPGGNIPITEFQKQPIIEHKKLEHGVEYKIFEKIYQKYGAVVYSPSRIRQNGSQGVVYIQDPDIFELKKLIDKAVESEIERQIDFEREEHQVAQPNIETQNRMPKSNVNIDHVKKAMGIDGNRFGKDLDGNIF